MAEAATLHDAVGADGQFEPAANYTSLLTPPEDEGVVTVQIDEQWLHQTAGILPEAPANGSVDNTAASEDDHQQQKDGQQQQQQPPVPPSTQQEPVPRSDSPGSGPPPLVAPAADFETAGCQDAAPMDASANSAQAANLASASTTPVRAVRVAAPIDLPPLLPALVAPDDAAVRGRPRRKAHGASVTMSRLVQ